MKSVKAFAPATIANFIVGFDCLGVAIKNMGDIVTLTKIDSPEIEIAKITCEKFLDINEFKNIPLNPKDNTATAGLLKMIEEHSLSYGFKVQIHKGIPLGSGLGGSSASAVAAVLAASTFLKNKLTQKDMLNYALDGEAAASGSRHADNVAPCLLGGLTLIDASTQNFVKIPMAQNIWVAVAYPGFRLDTKISRSHLPTHVSLKHCTQASVNIGQFIASCYNNDIELMRSSLKDHIIEPSRAKLIPGFYDVQKSALQNKAIACSISGAGPSLFAICHKKDAKKISQSMRDMFIANNHKSSLCWQSPIAKTGARVIK